MKINNMVTALLLLIGCSLTMILAATEERSARPSRACNNLNGSLKCSYCDRRFQQHNCLRSHENDHFLTLKVDGVAREAAREKKPITKKRAIVDKSTYEVVCIECGDCCQSFAGLKVHMRTHTGERPYACRYCNDRFTVSITRSRHELSHFKVKNFPCDLCSDTFSRKASMQNHRRIHTGEQPYPCNEPGCHELFRVLNDLRKHQRRTHTPKTAPVNTEELFEHLFDDCIY